MKAWRRSARLVAAPPGVATTISAPGGDVIECTGNLDIPELPFLWSYFGPTAAGPWTLLSTDPIFGDPQNIDYTFHSGEWAMVRLGDGTAPIGPESNTVQVVA